MRKRILSFSRWSERGHDGMPLGGTTERSFFMRRSESLPDKRGVVGENCRYGLSLTVATVVGITLSAHAYLTAGQFVGKI